MTFIDHNGAVDARPVFPFTALVGQPLLQRVLLLAAVDPGLGGVLVTGPRGTAKSTAARALAELLPPLANGAASPFATLPLSASLEQLVGTLDLGAALQDNQVRFSPGLLARAHGGVLYIDEVNLLPDALVDALLDAAASGVNTVERDGVSHHHAARFVLVGTMNPEEGELRPQLLDRFGLSVNLANPPALGDRLAVLRQRLAFDDDAASTRAQSADALRALATRIVQARDALPALAWTEPVLHRAAELAQLAGADGVRGDLACLRAARAWAAWQAQTTITPADVDAVAELALAHRRRSEAPPPPPPPQRAWGTATSTADEGAGDTGLLPPQPDAHLPVRAPTTSPQKSPGRRAAVGRSGGRSLSPDGLATRPADSAGAARLHWPRTLAAKGPTRLAADHLRWQVAEAPGQRLHCIVLDGSGSMRRHGGFAAARAMAQGLLADAVRRREQVAVLSLTGGRVTVLAAPQPARRSTVARLATLGSGGGTPLVEALVSADQLLARARRQQPALHTCLWLLTDGRTLDLPSRPAAATRVVVVDFDRGDSRAPGRASDWACAWGAEYLPPETTTR